MFGQNRQPYRPMTPQEMVAYASERGIQTPQSIIDKLTPQQPIMQEQPRNGFLGGLEKLLQNPNQALFGSQAPEGSYPMDSAPLADLRNILIKNPQSLGYTPQSLAKINQLGGQKVAEGMLQGLNFGIPEIAQNIQQYNVGQGKDNPINIPQTQEQIDLANRSSLNNFNTSATIAPKVGGLFNDIASGYKENRNTPFQIENLDQNQNKGMATRIGEGLGTLARFGQSPLGRGALVAGLIGATGGSGLEALAYGGTASVTNQQLKNQDEFYRDQFNQQGVDTSKVGGYITPEMFKNQTLANYRTGMLGIGNKRLSMSDYQNAQKQLQKQLTDGLITPDEYQGSMLIVNSKFKDDVIAGLIQPTAVGMSNQTFQTRVNMPKALGIQGANAAINAGRLNLAGQEFAVDAPYKQAQTIKIMGEMGKPQAERQQKLSESLNNIGYAENLIKQNPNLVGVYSPISAGAGRYTGGTLGMSKSDLAKRGEIARTVGTIKNELIQQAKSGGQSGINTMAEINQATAGIDENSSSQELLGALAAMKRVANRQMQLPATNIPPQYNQQYTPQVRRPARKASQTKTGGRDF